MNVYRIAAILCLSVTIVFAGDVARKGTTGADQLLIPVGARSIGTAGAFLSNTTGVEAIYYNPAGLSGSPYSEAMFGYMDYIADIKLSYFAAGFNAGDLGSFGLSFKNLNFGDIPVTTVDNPDGTGATYSPQFFVLGLTYAKEITDRVRAGVNAKFVNEGIMSTTASGIAFDFGVQYKFKGNLWLGVALKNVGGNMTYGGSDLQQKTSVPNGTQTAIAIASYYPVVEAFQLPSFFEISMAYLADFGEQNSLLLGANFRNNASLEDQIGLGVEGKAMDIVSLRLGYEYQTPNQEESQFGLTYGVGLNYDMTGIGINVDYAYRTFKSFGGSQVVTVKLQF